MAKIIVTDTETATMNGPIVDLAGIVIDEELNVVDQFETLLKPSRPIVPAAQAVHGITNDMVANAPTMQQWVDQLGFNPYDDDGLILFGHNVQFDARMLAAEDLLPDSYTKACTLRMSRNMWPDINEDEANHKLGTLAIMFNLGTGPAHRAMGDCVTCLNLLRHICDVSRVSSFQELLALGTRTLSPETKITFGKHKGTKLKDLDRGYRRWILDQKDMDPDLKEAIRALG